MPDTPPTIDEWRNLYTATEAFRRIECWHWLNDDHVFGVQDPVSKTIGYASVMGSLGELLGMVVYLGSDGLAMYESILAEEIAPPDDKLMFGQHCLMATFGDRRALDKQDLAVVRELGLKFRGRQGWTLFRSYRPGFLPWHLTQEEARFLTVVLPQATDMALRLKTDPDLLLPPEKGQYLVRVPITGDPDGWRDQWLEPPRAEPAADEPFPLNKARLAQVRQKALPRQGVWEIDVFHLSAVIQEGDRPYYPYGLMAVDRASGFVLCMHMAKKGEHWLEFQDAFLNVVEQDGRLPERIAVTRPEAGWLMQEIGRELGIKVETVRRFAALDRVKAEMAEMMGRGGRWQV